MNTFKIILYFILITTFFSCKKEELVCRKKVFGVILAYNDCWQVVINDSNEYIISNLDTAYQKDNLIVRLTFDSLHTESYCADWDSSLYQNIEIVEIEAPQ